MKYDDLEKTQDLFEINSSDEVPSPIENIEMEGASKENLTDDLTNLLSPDSSDEEVVKGAKEIKVKKEKKEKFNLKAKWDKLSKKKKILFIGGIILFLLIIIGLILFLVLKDDEADEEKKKPNDPVVIVEDDNYRFEDGVLVFLDKDKNEIGKYECENKDESLCYLANYSDEDNFDVAKNVYENGNIVSKRTKIYLNKYAFIYDNVDEVGLITLYNLVDNKKEGTYKLVKGFTDSDYVILKNEEDRYGALLFTEEGITKKIDFTYNYLGMISKNANVVAKNSNKYYIYDQNGKLLNKGLDYEIKSYTNKYIAVKDKDYAVYDYNGELVFNEQVDYVSLLDGYVALVKDNKLYIKDYENNKYNEDGITLNNKDYNQVNVYNDNKRLVETKKAFDIKVNKDDISISYKNKNAEKSVLINIYEGKLSSNMAFMNYFDSTLYFYNDEDKTELLGKYTCSNKNVVDKNTTSLVSCGVAKESFYNSINKVQDEVKTGLLPIFNKRYVFVYDYLDKANRTINLYDLTSKKVLVKYASVDAGIHEEGESLSFIEAPDIYIMAQNRNKKYGVIKIANEVSGAVSFDYANIERLKDYFVAESAQETYMLIDRSGKVVTEKLGRKIVDYVGNHLKTLSEDKYYVCDFTGETNDNTGYLDIELFDDYYVKITSSYELDIGKYDDGLFALSSPIYLGDDYEDNYEVQENRDGSFKITIKKSGEVYEYNSEGLLIIQGD